MPDGLRKRRRLPRVVDDRTAIDAALLHPLHYIEHELALGHRQRWLLAGRGALGARVLLPACGEKVPRSGG